MGVREPCAVVAEVEDFLAGGVDETDAFAAVVETAGVGAGDGECARVAGGEGGGVFDDERASAWVEGEGGEGEGDAFGEGCACEGDG